MSANSEALIPPNKVVILHKAKVTQQSCHPERSHRVAMTQSKDLRFTDRRKRA